MKKNKKKQKDHFIKENKKDMYISPVIEVTFVEMECGLAIESAGVSPVTVNGKADQVPTEWTSDDQSTIHAPFWN